MKELENKSVTLNMLNKVQEDNENKEKTWVSGK